MDTRTVVAAILLSSLLSACGSVDVDEYLPDQRLAYKKQREAADNLEIPPDLTSGNFDDAMDVPDLGGSATYSEYVGERKRTRQVSSSGEVLPEVKDVALKREGDRRWLEVAAAPRDVWPRLVGFWRSQGILLTEQDPSAGVMKTDWLENRAEISRDILTNTLRKVVDGLYETSTRDQYRIRIEPGLRAGTTDLYLTHRGMAERLVSNTVGEGATTVWEPSGSDPDKEAAMLRRLMVYLGVTEARAERVVAEERATVTRARLVQEGGGPVLLVDDEFRRAWRSTGVALDRIGFAVEDRDRTQGVYYVRYDDPTKGQEKKKGFMSKLAFWSSDDADTVNQYQVKLTASADQTRVEVRDQAGRRDNSPTGQRILTLLGEEMR
jgi:outer membrane protein assembly factor BamC